MQLSNHFTLAQAIKSQTAERAGIANMPNETVIARMQAVCENVLEAVLAHYGKPVTINSFYRSPQLNAAIGSKPNSQHVSGEAVDFEVAGVPNAEVAAWVRDNLTFDQCILEFHKPGVPDSGWVHVSYKQGGGCRQQCLTIDATGTVAGLAA